MGSLRDLARCKRKNSIYTYLDESSLREAFRKARERSSERQDSVWLTSIDGTRYRPIVNPNKYVQILDMEIWEVGKKGWETE